MTWEDLIKAKYVKGGRDIERDGGLDCWGFICAAYKLHGISLPLWDADEDYRDKNYLFSTESKTWERNKTPLASDVVLFKLPVDGWHCGIVMPDLVSFAHCMMPCARINKLDDRFWVTYFKGFYRWNR